MPAVDSAPERVLVPAARVERWVVNFRGRHGDTALAVVDGALRGVAADGSSFTARLPFGTSYDDLPDAAAFAAAVSTPTSWGVLLVRKGGFAVVRFDRDAQVGRKVGQRHVQGRTAAGGQSQQRFARRRDNQAQAAFDAAAGHCAAIMGADEVVVVTGGDHVAVDAVLTDPRLARLRVVEPWLPVPDPRGKVLDQAVLDARAVQVEVSNVGS